MICPKCQAKTSVYNSRPKEKTIRRQRECSKCKHRFATVEVLEVTQAKPAKPKPEPKAKPIPFERERPVRRKKKIQRPRRSRFEDLDFDIMTDEEIEAALDDYR